MSEEKDKKGKNETPPVEKLPVKEVLQKRCDHKGKGILEPVTAEEAEISSPLAREENVKIFRCKGCGYIVIEK